MVHILVHILAMVHRITQNNCADCADCLKFLVCGDVQDVVHISLTWRNTDFSGKGNWESLESLESLERNSSDVPFFQIFQQVGNAILHSSARGDAKTLLQAQHRGMPRHATATQM